MDVNAQTNDIYLTLTRREYTLITKALTGRLSLLPVERLGHDDVPDAKELGRALMERRLVRAEDEVGLVRKAIENAFSEE